MINIDAYIADFLDKLRFCFGTRLLYVGLQGSYMRGEATDNSDIDLMVILDELQVSDLDQYRGLVRSLDFHEKSCGFLCGRSDLANWNPLEICHLLNSTKNLVGTLDEFVPEYTDDYVCNFVKLSLNNLYLEICHRLIHSESNENLAKLSAAYKSVFFILQNLYYLKTKVFIPTKKELLPLLETHDRVVLERGVELNSGVSHDFSASFRLLFSWCQETLKTVSQ